MSRAEATKQYRDFTGGLNTDSSPLNMPENTVTDIYNMIIEKTGKLRRAQLTHQVAASPLEYVTPTSTYRTGQYKSDSYIWHAPNGDGDTTFLVVRIGSKLHFFNIADLGTEDPIADSLVGTISISASFSSGQYENPLTFATGRGRLYFVGRYCAPSFIEWDGATTFTRTQYTLEIRDFEGAPENTNIGTSPTYESKMWLYLTNKVGTFTLGETINSAAGDTGVVLTGSTSLLLRISATTRDLFTTPGDTITGAVSGATATISIVVPELYDQLTNSKNNRLYNLLNAGWTHANIIAFGQEAPAYKEPSRGMSWIYGKDVDDNFDPLLLSKHDFGNGKAPRGRTIFNAHLRSRSGAYQEILLEGASSVETVSDGDERASTCCFAVGRMWYSGINAPQSSTKILFSQLILEDKLNAGRCYQEQDPTSEIFNTLLDTDGGEFSIPDAGLITRLIPFRDGIVAFSDTGVWMINSGQTGFTPSSFSVTKITNQGILSPKSLVETPDSLFYWSPNGINIIALAADGFSLRVQSISENRINNLYNGRTTAGSSSGINATSKQGAKGLYDSKNNRIIWSYASTGSNSYVTESLVLDLDLGSYYGLAMQNNPGVHAYTVEGIDVPGLGAHFLRFDLSTTTEIGFGWYNFNKNDTTPSFLGSSRLETFYELLGDTSRKKGAIWAVLHFERTEEFFTASGGAISYVNPSSCMFSTKWDFTTTDTAGKWSTPVQGYRLSRVYIPPYAIDPMVEYPFDYSYSVITTKNKVRGYGRAVQFKFESEDDNDFILLGWDVVYSGDGLL